MLKSVLLCVLLWHELCECSDDAQKSLTDTATHNLPGIVLPPISNSKMQIEPMVNFIASQQVFHMNGPLPAGLDISHDLTSVDEVPKAANPVPNVIDVYKLYRRSVTWGRASQLCLQQGGHLADIKSEAEEKEVVKMMDKLSVDEAWVGYHDQFAEGDWISVFDEPLDESGWERWSTKHPVNPDNHGGSQNCAILMRNGGGMDDKNCGETRSFVCKITKVQ